MTQQREPIVVNSDGGSMTVAIVAVVVLVVIALVATVALIGANVLFNNNGGSNNPPTAQPTQEGPLPTLPLPGSSIVPFTSGST